MILLKILVILSLSAAVVTVIYLTVDGKDSFVFKMSLKIVNKLFGKEKRDRTKEKNTLFKCSNSNCNRLFRLYQAQLYQARKGRSSCPHCEDDVYFYRDNLMKYGASTIVARHTKRVDEEDSWMTTHPDCPKINQKELKNLEETVRKLKRAQEEKEELERFEEYNKISADLKWINNIQK